MVSSKALALSCTLLSALVQASPAPEPSLSRRQDGGVTSCDDEPQTYGGGYTDGQGTYVASDGVTHPYKFPLVRKCWWDYFIVEASEEVLPWEKSSGDVYCTDTERCVAEEVNSNQHCQERSESISADVGASIEGFTFGLGVTATSSESRCVTAQGSTACQWNDRECHTVWTQQQIIRQKGYRRHRCNWGNGDETECMADWEQITPTDHINYGCGSKCEDTNVCGNTDGTPCP
ncbi:hypothetical protein FALBO_1702 [Fusarium albosuccineum]|uniref:Uncharacterized protein n=1 Tax=Fusarium albosuccineum TaxID=1237068 RepID=A0A8H4LMD5_9HYPO|nr:hypothetical protein FALBO_1702 [Fusarium albosuccineum]